MKDTDHVFLEQMESEKFQNAVNDDFSFTDSLIDNTDLDKINNDKEDE